MDLKDALGDWPGGNQQPNNPAWQGHPGGGGGGGGMWPGEQSGGGGMWPGGHNLPSWPNQPTQPSQPSWPNQPTRPSQPGWPSQPAQPSQPSWPGQPAQPSGLCHPKVPFHQKLPDGVFDKLLITITGIVKPQAEKITVDMTTGPDIAFHFNPRFNDYGKKVIVRNSCIGKNWGHEERELCNFPFCPGQPFEMKILCTNSEFKVAVNNSHVLAFQHRLKNLKSITNLHIYYDVTLTAVKMETLP